MPVSSLGRRIFLIGSNATSSAVAVPESLELCKHRIYRILNFITNLLLYDSIYLHTLCTEMGWRISSVMRGDGEYRRQLREEWLSSMFSTLK